MRVLFYGESYLGTMGYSVVRALTLLGHQVDVVDPSEYLTKKKLLGKYTVALDRLLFLSIARRINRRVLSLCVSKHDLVLVLKGLHLYPQTVLALRKSARWVVNYNQDDFFNPRRFAFHVWSPFLNDAFQLYDVIFTARKHVIEQYKKKGARRVEYLPFSFDPEIFKPVSVSAADMGKLKSSVIFVGNWSRRREDAIKPLLNVTDVAIWGNSWRHSTSAFRAMTNCRVMGPTVQQDMSRLFNCSMICLNMYTPENNDHYTFRNFEISASGSFQLAERTPAAKEFFEEDTECIYFGSPQELIAKTIHYLKEPVVRREVAIRGYVRAVNSKYTYQDRMSKMLRTLGLE